MSRVRFGAVFPVVLLALHPITASASLCPDSSLIKPFCTCFQASSDVLPDLLCENFESAEQVSKLFNQSFPTNEFKSLIFEFSSLSSIKANSFADKTFKQISIERSKIKSIDRHAFESSRNTLEMIMVMGCENLSRFPLDGLWGFEKLKTIILSDLKIDSIRTLPSLPNLVKLAVNELREFKVLTQLPYLPNLTSLKIVSSGVNHIEENAFENLPKLEKFEFDGNDVKVLRKGYFKFHSAVQELSFEENGIEKVEEGALGGIDSVLLVSFTKNNIQTLDEKAFRPLLKALAKNSGKVLLKENKLECFCKMAWLINDAALKEALYEANCAGKTDLATLPENFLSKIC